VPDDARRHGVSVEVAGRHARQRFFEEARRRLKAGVIATAHTRDDQAETVLLRLTRGAGTAGLGAIHPRRDAVVRPLLECSREELRQHLRVLGETWRDDATNADCSIPRNRIRHEVMPALRAINAQADDAIARAAEILRGDDEFLARLANAAFLKSVEVDEGGGVSVNAAEFAKLPAAIARRVARYALETVDPDGSFGLEEADALRRALTSDTGADLPGLALERFGANAVLVKRRLHEAHGVRSLDPVEFRLDIPGTVEAPRNAWILTAEGPMAAPRSIEPDQRRVLVDAGGIGAYLIVRYRRPGDRLHPLGAPGRKKVQDVLVDRKVPRDDRDALPIVTTERGEIVWLAGEVLADPFRVTPLTRSVVVLTLRR